jgi:hypothetical protein
MLRSCGSDMESGKEWWWCSRTPRRGLHCMPLHEPSRLSPPHRKIFLLVGRVNSGFPVTFLLRSMCRGCGNLQKYSSFLQVVALLRVHWLVFSDH